MVSSKTSKTGPDVALRCIRGCRFWAIPISYETINTSNNAGKSTAFIEFMLVTIKASLIDALNVRAEMSDGTMDRTAMRWKQIESFLQIHAYVMNADVRALCNVSLATGQCRTCRRWEAHQISCKWPLGLLENI